MRDSLSIDINFEIQMVITDSSQTVELMIPRFRGPFSEDNHRVSNRF